MKKPLSVITLILFLLSWPVAAAYTQELNIRQLDWHLGVKLQYYLGWGSGSIEPGSHFTLGMAGGLTLREKEMPASIHLQLGANIYAGGLGTNIINSFIDEGRTERRRKLEVDFVNTAMLNIESGGLVDPGHRAWMPIQHFNHMTPYTNLLYRNLTLTYGISYLFNTSNRNQNIAFVGISSPWISLGMYNDGAVPFYLGDQYDRFWTGGGYLRINPLYSLLSRNSFIDEMSLEYNFHRFTYDVQDGYRLANLLSLPFVQDASFYNLLYNNSLTTIKANWRYGGLGMSWLGRSKVDVQDFIHRTLGYPLHLTYKPKELLLHFSYAPMFRK